MKYFISGHRDLSYEDFIKYYMPIIDKVIDTDLNAEFIVGDCNGVDKFAMDYIWAGCDCPLTIFHMFNAPRNVPEGMGTVTDAEEVYFAGGFTSDEERDSAMTKASNFDIAFIKDCRWDSGTAQNIKRRHNI